MYQTIEDHFILFCIAGYVALMVYVIIVDGKAAATTKDKEGIL